VRVPELAATFRTLAAKGPAAFYGPAPAAALAGYVAGATPQDGKMTAADVTGYTAKERAAVCTTYRVYKICGMGPPSSGGIAVAQMLGQLERFDLAALGPGSPVFWHLFIESQRLAYADRELYSGDSDFVDVPTRGLVDRAYLAQRSALIDPATTIAKPEAGVPPGAPLARGDGPEEPEHGTTHFAVVDAEGNSVSYTSTIEGAFGSGLHFRGFYLNNELTDFTLTPEADGKPVANRVEGGKRPRSSMAPTIVYDASGKVVLVIGAAGGPTIPVTVARGIIGVLDFKLGAQEALALPFAMSVGDMLLIEEGTPLVAMQAELERLGHKGIRIAPAPIKANALGRRADGGWEVATEPRLVSVVTP
ncbi:MAG TPA: gamma-glutamyltransferase, partial [Erythrobacter sp.]